MKRPLMLLCLLFLLSCQPNNKPAWTTVNEREFAISLPVDYEQIRDGSDNTAFGKLPVNYFYWRNPGLLISDLGVKLLECSYFDLPALPAGATPEWVTDSCISYWSHYYRVRSSGRLVSTEQVSSGSLAGKKIQACVNVGKEDSLLVFITVYTVGRRVYVLCANGYKSVADLPAIERFQDSFRLKE